MVSSFVVVQWEMGALDSRTRHRRARCASDAGLLEVGVTRPELVGAAAVALP